MSRIGLGLLLLVLSVVGVSAGCAEESARDKLVKRAAFDLKCTKDEIRVTKIDDRTRGVRGCGKQATYIRTCDYLGVISDCTWVMNTRTRGHDEEDD